MIFSSACFYALTLFIGMFSIATNAHPVAYPQNDTCLYECQTQYAEQWGVIMALYNSSRSPVSAISFGFKDLFDKACGPAEKHVRCTQKCLEKVTVAGKYNGSVTFSDPILKACHSRPSGLSCVDNSTVFVKSVCNETEKKVVTSLDRKYLWTMEDKVGSPKNLTDFCRSSKTYINCVENAISRRCDQESASFVKTLMTYSIASIVNLGDHTKSLQECEFDEIVTLAITSPTESTKKYSTTVQRENSSTVVTTESSKRPEDGKPLTAAAPKPVALIWMSISLALVSILSFNS